MSVHAYSLRSESPESDRPKHPFPIHIGGIIALSVTPINMPFPHGGGLSTILRSNTQTSQPSTGCMAIELLFPTSSL